MGNRLLANRKDCCAALCIIYECITVILTLFQKRRAWLHSDSQNLRTINVWDCAVQCSVRPGQWTSFSALINEHPPLTQPGPGGKRGLIPETQAGNLQAENDDFVQRQRENLHNKICPGLKLWIFLVEWIDPFTIQFIKNVVTIPVSNGTDGIETICISCEYRYTVNANITSYQNIDYTVWNRMWVSWVFYL